VANAKNITSGDANILVVGDSGTRKTRFFGTFPAGTVEIADFDKGMASLAGQDIEFTTFKETTEKTVKPWQEKVGIYPTGMAWPAFIQWINKIGDRIEKGTGPKVIGLDSLSFMSMIAMSKILKDGGWDVPNQGAYGAQQEYLKRVLNQVSAWPVRLICTAHIKRDDNLVTGISEKLPLLTGQLAGFISAFFDEVYFVEPVAVAAKAATPGSPAEPARSEVVIRTKQTPQMRQAKSRWNVPDGTPLDWAQIAPFLPDKG
jgi:hypothetical protein